MRRWLVLIIAVVGLSVPVVLAQNAPKKDEPKLSSELTLRVQLQAANEQVHNLEIQATRCEAQLSEANAKLASGFLTTQAADLNQRRSDLSVDVLKALGGDAKAGDTVDWATNPPSVKHAPKKENK